MISYYIVINYNVKFLAKSLAFFLQDKDTADTCLQYNNRIRKRYILRFYQGRKTLQKIQKTYCRTPLFRGSKAYKKATIILLIILLIYQRKPLPEPSRIIKEFF